MKRKTFSAKCPHHLLVALLLFHLPAYVYANPLKAQNGDSAPKLDFMLGTWFIQELNTYETWQKEGEGYKGKAYFLSGDEEKLFETFRVAQEDSVWYYIAEIPGQGVTHFALVETKENKVVFSNPEHDMPSTITYWLEGSVRKVKLEGTEGPKAVSHSYDLIDPIKMKPTNPAADLKTKSTLGSYCQISIGTKKIEENVAFYKALGFKISAQDNAPWPWVMLTDGSVNIQLNDDGYEYFGLTYFDADMVTKVNKLKDKGVTFFMESKEPAPTSVMQDPDSIMGIALVQYQGPLTQIPAMTPGALGVLGEIAVPVKDYEASSAWYSSIGFKSMGKQTDPYPWGIHSDGLVMIGLHQTREFKKPTLTYFSLDAKAHIARLKEAGLDVRNALPGGGEITNGVVNSPDGWPVNIFYGSL